MEKYIINYHTGVTEEIEVSNLKEAKDTAEEGMAYTQEKVTIEQPTGDVLTTAHWCGVEPEEDDEVLCKFGSFGFYSQWTDELGE